MSNVNPPAEMIAASEAYDTACRTLQNIGQLEVDREIIARGILRKLASSCSRLIALVVRALLH